MQRDNSKEVAGNDVSSEFNSEKTSLESAIRKSFSLDHHGDTAAEDAALMKFEQPIKRKLNNDITNWLKRNQETQQEAKPALVTSLLLEGMQLWDKIPQQEKSQAIIIDLGTLQNVTKNQNASNLSAVQSLKDEQAKVALSEVRKGLEEWKKQDDAAPTSDTPSTPRAGNR